MLLWCAMGVLLSYYSAKTAFGMTYNFLIVLIPRRESRYFHDPGSQLAVFPVFQFSHRVSPFQQVCWDGAVNLPTSAANSILSALECPHRSLQ